MTKVIIYKNEINEFVVLMPAFDCGLTLEQIALKDVPTGAPFRYIEEIHLPSDAESFLVWELDMKNPDGFGADYGVGSSNDVIGWNKDGTPITKK